jgi:hypothetical protein
MRDADALCEFDRAALNSLRDRYDNVLREVLSGLDGSCQERLSGAERTAVARHLLLAFAACEALGPVPSDFVDLWQAYSTMRILPLLRVNERMSAPASRHAGSSQLLVACLQAMVSLTYANELRDSVPRFSQFWSAIVGTYRRMLTVVCEEVSLRYDERAVLAPDIALARYESNLSPLLRSSMLEMPLFGMAAVAGTQVEPSSWVPNYERARQLLDDAADVREDLGRGRLTYPVLISLSVPDSGELQERILRLWERSRRSGTPRIADPEWARLRAQITRLGGYEASSAQALDWLDTVERGCLTTLRGNPEPLLVHINLKRAFLERLQWHGFEDSPPPAEL